MSICVKVRNAACWDPSLVYRLILQTWVSVAPRSGAIKPERLKIELINSAETGAGDQQDSDFTALWPKLSKLCTCWEIQSGQYWDKCFEKLKIRGTLTSALRVIMQDFSCADVAVIVHIFAKPFCGHFVCQTPTPTFINVILYCLDAYRQINQNK